MLKPSKIHRHAMAMLFALHEVIACPSHLSGQTQSETGRAVSTLAWSTDSTGPSRFISVHGRRAAIFGYSEDGLEIWAYPLQILSSLRVAFRSQSTTTGIDGQTILRGVIYSPERLTRIYAGPDFIVREELFVPLDLEGAIISYEVESARPVDVVIRFIPVLDLMWPASLGGQEAVWNDAASAYLLSESTHRFTASVGSPDMVAHDETSNSSRRVGRSPGLAFTIRAGGRDKTARVIVAGSASAQDPSAIAKRLLQEGPSLEKAAVDHYSSLLSHALQIETPDPDTNRALAWSEIALDQAWVCNPVLGCGLVAGYGPSRKARRPQYDWFFAGDGMVALHGLLAAGQYDRARQELEFILKYQDQKTGMIWHELSQSAGWLDWAKYPYMYVHVELTFDFLAAVADYFAATGDQKFVSVNWESLQSAYQYCRALLDPKDGLPRIPFDKEGSREQEALSDELTLSASWVAAAQSFANLAAATGHGQVAQQAAAASQQGSRAIAQRYWDERQHFWITGYTRSGAPLIDRAVGPASVLGKLLFSQEQRNSLADQLASSDFQADWGTRGKASSASTYDPNSYASGSVWAIGTAGTATAFWAEHRPATALPIWRALVPWSSLDSLGHMHEALAGDYYHEELESVPEQTWSSASFFTATVNGLLGLHVDGASNRITFAPHLPASWDTVTLRNVHVGASDVRMNMVQSVAEVRLLLQNEGTPVGIVFDPEIPLGAKIRSARIGNRSVVATLKEHPHDSHARMEFNLPHGSTLLTLSYVGGVAIMLAPSQLEVGEPSKDLKITGMHLEGRVLAINFDYRPSGSSSFKLRTPWIISRAQGAAFEAIAPAVYRVTVSASLEDKATHDYQKGKVIVTFASDSRSGVEEKVRSPGGKE